MEEIINGTTIIDEGEVPKEDPPAVVEDPLEAEEEAAVTTEEVEEELEAATATIKTVPNSE